MIPSELAEELDRCIAANKHYGTKMTLFTIHPDQMPLLAAALRGMEAVDAMARRNATLVPPLPHEGLSPAEYEALLNYRAERAKAAT